MSLAAQTISQGAPDAGGAFMGFFEHQLDPKKRLTIPADWRELVGPMARLFVLPGIGEPCLYLYPAAEFNRRLDKLRALSIADRDGRALARALGSRSDYLGWDGQGRIRISDRLLAHAGVKRQVVLNGAIDRFELWTPDNWARQDAGLTEASLVGQVEHHQF